MNLGRFGLKPELLEEYATRFDALIRPIASSQIIAGILGCLPASTRARMLKGNQMLLLSKLAQVLVEAQEVKLESGEMVKLAGVLRSAGQVQRTETGSSARSKGRPSNPDAALFDHDRFGRAVRVLYGLSWPPCDRGE
jgi:hypothetical protein